MPEKVFFDTNVFVYANDARDEKKQQRAINTIRDALVAHTGVISTQVLNEYAAAALTKLGQPVAAIMRQLLIMERMYVYRVDGALIRDALTLGSAFSLSYWDSVIVAAAQVSGCSTLVTEDLSDGALYGTVRVQSPF